MNTVCSRTNAFWINCHMDHVARNFLVLSVILLAGVMGMAAPAGAQQIANSLAGFASDPDAPIDIESDRLDVDDIAKLATFSGNVKAVQGDFVLRSKTLEVVYSGSAGKPSGGSGTEVTHLKAKGKVFITSKNRQTATSEWANFDVKKQMITVGGNVILTQGDNIIKGDRLVIDLKSGQSYFETSADTKKPGRIRMLIKKPPKAKPNQ